MGIPYYGNANEACSLFAPAVIVIVVLCIVATVAAVHIVKAALYCVIFSKAGYCWAWGLLVLVPFLCVVLPFVLAFAKWPIQRELEHLRQQLGQTRGS